MTAAESNDGRLIGELSARTGMSADQIASLTPLRREGLELAAAIVDHYASTRSSVFTISENRSLAVLDSAVGFLRAWQWQAKRPEIISSPYDQRLLFITPPNGLGRVQLNVVGQPRKEQSYVVIVFNFLRRVMV